MCHPLPETARGSILVRLGNGRPICDEHRIVVVWNDRKAHRQSFGPKRCIQLLEEFWRRKVTHVVISNDYLHAADLTLVWSRQGERIPALSRPCQEPGMA